MNPILHEFLQVKYLEVNHTIHESLQKWIPSEGIFFEVDFKDTKMFEPEEFHKCTKGFKMKEFATFEGIISKGFKTEGLLSEGIPYDNLKKT